MTAETERTDLLAKPRTRRSRVGSLGRRARLRVGSFAPHIFTSLTRRIVVLNLGALLVLVLGILFLNQFRAGLIESRTSSLLIQGEIIAAAVAASATVDIDTLTIDPEELLELQAGASPSRLIPEFGELDFSINPERVAPVLRRLITPTGTRARIYDRDGSLILDSRHLYPRSRRHAAPESLSWTARLSRQVNAWLSSRDTPVYEELGGRNGRGYEEVARGFDGTAGSVVRRTEAGELIVSVAVPIRRFRDVHGVLLLSTEGSDIDDIVYAERLAIMRVFVLAATVSVVLSVILAVTIAAPLRRLADAADRVRRRAMSRPAFPNLADRGDEVGHLTRAMADMTTALFDRMTAIENFAADVAHELKNPLTSLRSAVETLPLAKSADERKRLSDVILHDVRRLDRLISDISDASRLDAELVRQESSDVDLRHLLEVVVGMAGEAMAETGCELALAYEDDKPFMVRGHDSRLAQVFTNLLDNARSFAGKGGHVAMRVARGKECVEIVIDDDGPGIRSDQFERIFERFYTDRAENDGFGQNSGLGLSISRQIVEAHGGGLIAENHTGDDGKVAGARFVVRLPAE